MLMDYGYCRCGLCLPARSFAGGVEIHAPSIRFSSRRVMRRVQFRPSQKKTRVEPHSDLDSTGPPGTKKSKKSKKKEKKNTKAIQKFKSRVPEGGLHNPGDLQTKSQTAVTCGIAVTCPAPDCTELRHYVSGIIL